MTYQYSPGSQLIYVQWLRIFLTVLVVAHHAGQPYGPTGGDWPMSDPTKAPVLSIFFSFNAAFFMGFFFLISGFFVENSFDRQGARAFITSKLARLGVPLVFGVVLLFGLVAFAREETQQSFFAFILYNYLGRNMEFGPLWFLAHLLIYSILYAVWREFGASVSFSPPVSGHIAIAIFTVALTIVTYPMRQLWPQDVWVKLFGIIPLEPAHLPQYASLYFIGIIAARGQWLELLPVRTGLIWLAWAIAALVVASVLSMSGTATFGVLSAHLIWDLGEPLICVGTILGLIVLFRAFANAKVATATWLANHTFGVYLIHVFLVVAVQKLLIDAPLGALSKFAIAIVGGLTWSLLSVWLLRFVPGLRQIL